MATPVGVDPYLRRVRSHAVDVQLLGPDAEAEVALRRSLGYVPPTPSMPSLARTIAPVFAALLAGPASGQVADNPDQPPPNPYLATAESIWPGIVRFYASAEDKANAPPSLIVQIPKARYGPPPENPPV